MKLPGSNIDPGADLDKAADIKVDGGANAAEIQA
jgi:hypothetical protein